VSELVVEVLLFEVGAGVVVELEGEGRFEIDGAEVGLGVLELGCGGGRVELFESV